ncbi:MAG TPA: pyrroloquinoline quinone biosynthesis protein PqqE [Nevskiaceae bacterium]|nr:pyrroloquinoline quinone biosynthesis protein PqqE [Nevskiaceae bacterium]
MPELEPPLGLLLELTHRCPLQCPYCSNPVELETRSKELDTATWLRVIDEAAALGVLQVHFSGGEPMARRDLPQLVERAAQRQLYTNLITSAVLLDERRLAELAKAGLDHVQISFQDIEPENADRIGGYRGGHAKKLEAARLVKAAGLALTLNFVVHRQNAERVQAMIAFAEASGAGRVEIAHVQYYGWGLRNRSALLPSRAQLEAVTAVVTAARERLKGRLTIDYVVPDYYAARPKACMSGWGRRFMNISPAGRVLPCHAAETLPGLTFESVRDTSLAEIWRRSPAFQKFRGTDWMPEPCKSCDRREIDWGGCRCQAFALTGDASRTDPACALSPDRAVIEAAVRERDDVPRPFVYRRYSAAAENAVD